MACSLDSLAIGNSRPWLRNSLRVVSLISRSGMAKQNNPTGGCASATLEVPRPDYMVEVSSGDAPKPTTAGPLSGSLDSDRTVVGTPDTPVPGYNNNTVNKLRLWSARASRVQLSGIRRGRLHRAVVDKPSPEHLEGSLSQRQHAQDGNSASAGPSLLFPP